MTSSTPPAACNNWGAIFSRVHAHNQKEILMHKRPLLPTKVRRTPRQFSWVDHRLVRERYIDQLSPEACALYLFLVTVADAQGLSYYAERSLCQRLSMAAPRLRQARQLLIEQGLVAYQRPLYQVLALEEPPPAQATGRQPHDDCVDIQGVFQQIWKVLT
jgi:hypothetical protein